MTMPTNSLSTVLDQAQGDRDQAYVLLESSRKVLEDAKFKLQSLQEFRTQYEQRWQGQFKQAGGMEILRCYQDFMGRLTDAVNDQMNRVNLLEKDHDQRRHILIEAERRVSAIQKVVERRQQEVVLQTSRREQRDTDELATRLSLRSAKLQSPSC